MLIRFRSRSLRIALTLAAGLALPRPQPAHAVLAGKMFWIENSARTIKRASLDGTAIETLVTGLQNPIAIVVDNANDKMYIGDTAAHNVQRFNLDGTGGIVLMPSRPRVEGIALDVAGGRLYWGDCTDYTIQRANLADGSGVTTLANPSSGVDFPEGVALDLPGGRIYWAERTSGKVQRSNIDGSGVQTLLSGEPNLFSMSLDLGAGRMYWTNVGSGGIRRANLDGTNNAEIVSTGLSFPAGLDLDLPAGKAYWSDASTSLIARSSLDGTNLETLLTGLTSPFGMAIITGAVDCNSNGTLDNADIAAGTSRDCDSNGTPDECQIAVGSSAPGGPFFCTANCSPDCDSDAVPDACEPDCNGNTVPDVCDLAAGTARDCNSNGRPDSCDISGATSGDCNGNAIPDECDMAGPTSGDCDANGRPDECDGPTGDVHWIGADGGLYTTGANWDRGLPPSGGAAAILQNGTNVNNRCLLTGSGEIGVCSLSISGAGAGMQVLQIDGGRSLLSRNGTALGARGQVDLRGGRLSGGTIANTGGVLSGYGEAAASIVNQATVQAYVGGALRVTGPSLDHQPTGLLRSPIASVLHVQSPSVALAGMIDVRSQAALVFESGVTNSAGGHVTLIGGTLGAPTFVNAAGATITGAGTIESNVNNQGDLTVIADFLIAGDLQNDGTVTIQSGILTITGSLTGSGTIIGSFGGRDATHALREAHPSTKR